MDPYLEDPSRWHSFHSWLAPAIAAHLNKQIGPKYYADVEVYTVIDQVSISRPRTIYPDISLLEKKVKESGRTDQLPTLVDTPISVAPVIRPIEVETELRLRTVKVYAAREDELVTVIEILSPVNKRRSGKLADYRKKRQEILASEVNLVELDLLRGGIRPGPEVAHPPLDTDYVLLVNRTVESLRDRVSEIWPVAISEPLPVLPVPLLPEDGNAPFSVGEVMQRVYEESNFTWRINYQAPVPPPPLRPEMVRWMHSHLPQVGVQKG
jgi:hypothetical protein